MKKEKNIELIMKNKIPYEKFEKILNDNIFLQSKSDLIRKFADYPERYIGLFRPTKPKGKIIQNLTQSAEIKFGNAFEYIIKEYFNICKYTNLPTIFRQENKKKYDLDQLFLKDDRVIFIEQKVRDDHDSSKKRGQIDNFIKKIEILQDEYPDNNLDAIFYFIDDGLQKNKNYYQQEILQIANDYGINCKLMYARDLFDYYDLDVWSEIISYLKVWKDGIPDMPEINFDNEINEIFDEIKNIETNKFRRIFDNLEIFNTMMLTISPEKKLLNKLLEYFKLEYSKNNGKKIYKTLHDKLEDLLK
jgi:hypothetical protein